MNGIDYSYTMKCKTYDCYVTHYFNTVLFVRSKERRLFFPKSLISKIQKCNGGGDKYSFNGLRLSSDVINELLKYNGDEICVYTINSYISIDEYLTHKNFANIQMKNPYMDIKWPVRKGESKLAVQATGSGFYLYYNNEKAKRPDGSVWHGTREQLLYDMFYLNGWNIPENLTSFTI